MGIWRVKSEARGAVTPAHPPDDLNRFTTSELLALHADIGTTLKDRGVTRSANNPTGDYAEHLFAKSFGWTLASNSNAKFDATDVLGRTYQIKARRMTRGDRSSRQLGVMRNLTNGGFDYLAAVIFRANYEVDRAIIIPHDALEPICRFSAHQNGWILRLDDLHWAIAGAVDATRQLQATASILE